MTATTLSHRIAEASVRMGIAIVGLLVLRGIVSVMPMLRTEPIYGASVLGIPSADPQNPLSQDQLQRALTAGQLGQSGGEPKRPFSRTMLTPAMGQARLGHCSHLLRFRSER